MRNLKRALSLTLASVMLLGMMVIGSSAASYPDVDQEDNVEAIEVLQAVGVMQGDDKGNFDPDREVSRNEMAIVMAKLLNLDYNYYSESCPFWDVPDYAKPYVGACYANGIVSGYNANTYGGADTVTAVQAASMMMRALGYFQYDSDYADGFVISTVRQASKIGLFKDINAGQESPLTRNQVAQLALNTLETGMVEAKKTTSDISIGSGDTAVTINGAVEYVYVTSRDESINTAIDNVEASSIGTQNDSMILELGEKLYNGDLKKYGEKTNGDKYEYDDFGRPAVVWTYKNDKVGTYAKENDLVATYTAKVTKGDIYNLLSSAVRSDLEDGDSALTVTVDGQKIHVGRVTDPAEWYVRNSSDAIYTFHKESSRNGTLTEVYLDKDNNVDIVIVNTYVYQATSDYSSSRDDVKMAPVGDTALALKAGELTLNGEDFDLTDIVTDNYLLITAASETGSNYEVQSVQVADKLEGEVTGYADQDSVTIDGTTYNYSATALKTAGANNVRATTYTVGQDAIVVLDAYGYIIAVDEAVSSSSFVFIKEIGSNSGLGTKAVADAYFTDGTNEEINLDRVTVTKPGEATKDYKSGSAIYNARGDLGSQWYTYSVNSDGKYVLYGLTSGRANASQAYGNDRGYTQIVTNGKVDFLNGNAAIANDKTIMIVKDKNGDVTAYTGTANIPDINLPEDDTATVYFATNSSKGYTEYAFVDLENTDASVVDGGDDTSFLYVLRFKDDMYGSGATRYFNYSVINSETGAEEKVPFDTNYFNGEHPYELRYKPRYNGDDRVTSLTEVPNEWGKTNGKYINRPILGDGIVSYKDGSLKIGDTNLIVNADSKITLVIKKSDSTMPLLADKGNDHEFYFETQAQTVESLLKDGEKSYKVTGHIAGATKSSTSSVIDTLYITVTDVSKGGGGDQPGPGDKTYTVKYTVDGAEQTKDVKEGEDFKYEVTDATKVIDTVKIDGTDKGSIAADKKSVTVPEADAKTGTIVITLKSASTKNYTLTLAGANLGDKTKTTVWSADGKTEYKATGANIDGNTYDIPEGETVQVKTTSLADGNYYVNDELLTLKDSIVKVTMDKAKTLKDGDFSAKVLAIHVGEGVVMDKVSASGELTEANDGLIKGENVWYIPASKAPKTISAKTTTGTALIMTNDAKTVVATADSANSTSAVYKASATSNVNVEFGTGGTASAFTTDVWLYSASKVNMSDTYAAADIDAKVGSTAVTGATTYVKVGENLSLTKKTAATHAISGAIVDESTGSDVVYAKAADNKLGSSYAIANKDVKVYGAFTVTLNGVKAEITNGAAGDVSVNSGDLVKAAASGVALKDTTVKPVDDTNTALEVIDITAGNRHGAAYDDDADITGDITLSVATKVTITANGGANMVLTYTSDISGKPITAATSAKGSAAAGTPAITYVLKDTVIEADGEDDSTKAITVTVGGQAFTLDNSNYDAATGWVKLTVGDKAITVAQAVS